MVKLYSVYQCDDCGTTIQTDDPEAAQWRDIGSYQIVFDHSGENEPTDVFDKEYCAPCYAKRYALINGTNPS